ncbi:ABC transporter substrate-binding protein [Roseovarius salinarum]|uniref:ABC transporter substrate-binding protein n=1 Tax=Roseovarius salinarum TaxID=1981892 RepID=UPI0013000669|nr:ABC transporter substrate-binding protein [Roseovarius salinarum]
MTDRKVSPKLSRRGFLASSAAMGAAGMISSFPAMGRAEMGKVLRLRMDGDPDVLDPGYMSGGIEIESQKQCLPFLADYHRDGDTITWKPTVFVNKLEQRDPTHIDFELAEGLEWSDGYGPVMASDVKYSFERMTGTDWSGYFDALDHVEVTGDRTGTIVLNKPFAPFIMVTLCHGPGAILSEKAMKDVGEKFTTNFPATCGPYTYAATPGQRVVFELDPNWSGPAPGYERVEANIITEVKAAELAFEAGEIDCTEVGADTLARYTADMPEGAEITVAGELQYMWLGMNTDHPKLKDKTVRRAIQHAVDVDSILQGAYSGTTAKSYGIICPGLVGNRDSTRYYQYDPEKARALLAEAGVSGLELTLRTLNNQERMLAAQIIQANLGQIGISVKVLPLDSGPFWEMGQESKGDTWKDLQLWLMRYGTTPDPYEATQWFVSDQVGVWNWERWTDPEYDRLYEEGIRETDPDKRRDIYVRMQEIMEETGAYVWINHEPEAFVHSSAVDVNAAPSGELNYRRCKPA